MAHYQSTDEFMVKTLRVLGIQRIVFTLDGGGDSGNVDITEIDWANEKVEKVDLKLLPSPTPGFSLASYMIEVVADMPDGDWVNNEGGYGTITFMPFASKDIEECVEIDMSYHEYHDEYEHENDFYENMEIDIQNDAVAPAQDVVSRTEFGEIDITPEDDDTTGLSQKT